MRLTTFILFLLGLSLSSYSQNFVSLKFEWTYTGQNIYVQNPFRAAMDSFCTKEAFVNGQRVNVSLQSSSYEIDLRPFLLKTNDTVQIEIIHDRSCRPKVLSNFHHPKKEYGYDTLIIQPQSLTWIMNGKLKMGIFYVEHFENNNWKIIDTNNVRTITDTVYTSSLKQHSGLNKYRVKLIRDNGEVLYSQQVEIVSTLPKLEIHLNSDKKIISFNRISPYELLNENGEILKQEESATIDMSSLKSGIYYINADNRVKKIKIK